MFFLDFVAELECGHFWRRKNEKKRDKKLLKSVFGEQVEMAEMKPGPLPPRVGLPCPRPTSDKFTLFKATPDNKKTWQYRCGGIRSETSSASSDHTSQSHSSYSSLVDKYYEKPAADNSLRGIAVLEGSRRKLVDNINRDTSSEQDSDDDSTDSSEDKLSHCKADKRQKSTTNSDYFANDKVPPTKLSNSSSSGGRDTSFNSSSSSSSGRDTSFNSNSSSGGRDTSFNSNSSSGGRDTNSSSSSSGGMSTGSACRASDPVAFDVCEFESDDE